MCGLRGIEINEKELLSHAMRTIVKILEESVECFSLLSLNDSDLSCALTVFNRISSVRAMRKACVLYAKKPL